MTLLFIVAVVFGFLLVSFGAALLIGRFIAVGQGPERGGE